MLDLESEAMRGLGSIPTGVNILSLEFFLFSRSKDKNANIGIFVKFVKNSNENMHATHHRCIRCCCDRRTWCGGYFLLSPDCLLNQNMPNRGLNMGLHSS